MYVNLIYNKRDICYSYNEDLYWSIVHNNARPAVSAETKWQKLLGIQHEKLTEYYQLPFVSIRHTKIQCILCMQPKAIPLEDKSHQYM